MTPSAISCHAPSRAGDAWVPPLLRWYGAHKRPLPWRSRSRPYEIWISEIMLQQTQVATAIPYYRRFLRRFPSARSLAAAPLDDVLKIWQGLGYYSRARNLRTAAQAIVRDHRGQVPRTVDALRSLPGIGAYTAAAIASICFGVPEPVVDGNVLRVFTRFLALRTPLPSSIVTRRIQSFLTRHIPAAQPGDFNQAIMELGATLCRPRAPQCERCPLRADCAGRRKGWTLILPARRRRRPIPFVEIVAGIIQKQGRILIAQRRPRQMLGGLWEFPGGKREPAETLPTALRREIREETGLTVRVGKPLCVVDHAYSHFRIRLHVFFATPVRGKARALSSEQVKWVAPSQLSAYPFPAANRRVIEALRDKSVQDAHSLGRTAVQRVSF